MKSQFFSGNSLEQAVLLAARHFGLEPERVAYTLRDKKHGFLKVRRRVVIEVDPAAPELPPGAPPPQEAPEPEPPALPAMETAAPAGGRAAGGRAAGGRAAGGRPARAPEAAARFEEVDLARPEQRMPLSETASVERAVREILRFLKLEAEVAVERRPDAFEVEISRTDRETLLDKEGRLLQAMEYLVPRLVRSWAGQGVPVKIDCDGFSAERERELRALAAQVADEVRRDGVAQSLEPMHPADRRWVHLALADDPEIATESEGDGYYKRVRIFATDSSADDSAAGESAAGNVSRETWAVPFPR
jgi:spoIIIJ-associated protein